MMKQQYLATSPAGVGVYLAQELLSFGAEEVVERPVGVSFTGTLALAYRVCLWSRLANRVILQLGAFDVRSTDDIYEAVTGLDWGARSTAAILEFVHVCGGCTGNGRTLHERCFRRHLIHHVVID